MWAVLAVLVPEQAGSIRERQADPKVPGKKQLQLLVVKLTKTWHCAVQIPITVLIQIPDMSGIQMVQSCSVIEWSNHVQLSNGPVFKCHL